MKKLLIVLIFSSQAFAHTIEAIRYKGGVKEVVRIRSEEESVYLDQNSNFLEDKEKVATAGEFEGKLTSGDASWFKLNVLSIKRGGLPQSAQNKKDSVHQIQIKVDGRMLPNGSSHYYRALEMIRFIKTKLEPSKVSYFSLDKSLKFAVSGDRKISCFPGRKQAGQEDSDDPKLVEDSQLYSCSGEDLTVYLRYAEGEGK